MRGRQPLGGSIAGGKYEVLIERPLLELHLKGENLISTDRLFQILGTR